MRKRNKPVQNLYNRAFAVYNIVDSIARRPRACSKGVIGFDQVLQPPWQGLHDQRLFRGPGGAAAQSCYGVCGMATGGTSDSLKTIVLGTNYPDKGVRVTEEDGKLVIELHIKVTYGLNIAAIVRSITHKVKYAVEDATTLKVERIDVYVDDIV